MGGGHGAEHALDDDHLVPGSRLVVPRRHGVLERVLQRAIGSPADHHRSVAVCDFIGLYLGAGTSHRRHHVGYHDGKPSGCKRATDKARKVFSTDHYVPRSELNHATLIHPAEWVRS
ncbi:hypothetical protein GCM10010168_27460 [Actinoplanes ianthinogenes]|uniref:Uncharacterized protein n=1 Tax=Actinoplanes ianthinogenes TaxID=122358 RepID=A0ABM7LKU2_9ACTN|nr:hypothetical protein Aiant_05440 [Actinoplanes ianthinogenes]GGR08796.1 hypothetical protein GCM10010168_27460 [Actinoplanes ianthinogenes]